jgi:hypothetical protein
VDLVGRTFGIGARKRSPAGGDRGELRVARTTRDRSIEDGSPTPSGPSGAVVRLERRSEHGPRVRDLRAECFARRELRGQPAFGGDQLKSRPCAADGADPVVQGLLVGLVELVEVPGAGRIETDHIDREPGIPTGPPGHADTDHAVGRDSDHAEARAGTPLRESCVVAPVVRAPVVHVARRGVNEEGETHRGGPVDPVAPLGHGPVNRRTELSAVSGSRREVAPSTDASDRPKNDPARAPDPAGTLCRPRDGGERVRPSN